MIRGMYAAASGMMSELAAQDVWANNLANVGTVGYRRQGVAVRSFAQALDAALGGDLPVAQANPLRGGARPVVEAIDWSEGPLEPTNSPLDLALRGPGFFVIQTAEGPRYTRDGRFRVDAEGLLVTQGGQRVLGRQGPIAVPGRDLLVNEDGEIFSEGQLVDELLLVDFDDGALYRTKPGQFAATGVPRPAEEARVCQGYVEEANVQPIGELTRMIVGFRVYEANQRALQMQDQTLDRLINRVGG